MPKIFSARWVVPVATAPIENGAVLVEDAVIARVGTREEVLSARPDADVEDFGHAIITPGLINLHTHLDYTAMRHADTDSGMFGWIRSLVSGARKFQEDDWLHSAMQGATEVALSGTTCLADSSYRGTAAEAACFVGLRAVIGLELFGIDQERAAAVWQDWLVKFAKLEATLAAAADAVSDSGAAQRILLTVAPHAPYTVSPALWRLARDWAQERHLPVLCHLAESQAECHFLRGEGGEVIDYLAWVYNQDADAVRHLTRWRQHDGSPVHYLQRHELFGPLLLAAHAIKLEDDDCRLLRQAGAAVAHCPRSNARLRNGFAPLKRFFEENLFFGFGTDSAASTADLSVLQEARFSLHALRLLEPDYQVGSETFFHHLTLGAARSLGMEKAIGSLEAGKLADLAVFAIDGLISGAALNRPYEMLMHGGVRATDVFVNGRAIVVNGVIERRLPSKMVSTAHAKTSS